MNPPRVYVIRYEDDGICDFGFATNPEYAHEVGFALLMKHRDSAMDVDVRVYEIDTAQEEGIVESGNPEQFLTEDEHKRYYPEGWDEV